MDKRKMMWSFIISSFFRNNYVFCLIILCIAFILGKGELNPWEGQKMFPPMNKTGIVHEYTLVLRKERLEGHLKVQYTINHTVPGPLILIPLGDSVAITVINEIPNDATTLHWHGMTLSKEGYNDGVVGLTQCSIKNTTAMNTFTYRFTPQASGTYWYHSHFHSQYPDGLYGGLIVTSPREEEAYQEVNNGQSFSDNEEHVYLIADYFLGDLFNITKYFLASGPIQTVGQDPIQDSFTINNVFSDEDRQRFDPRYQDFLLEDVPKNTFVLKADKERIRFTNAGAFGSYTISVDQAIMEIIEIDGIMIKSVFVDQIMLHVAQRISFLLHFTEPTDSNVVDAELYLKVKLDPSHYPQYDPSLDSDNMYGITSHLPLNYLWKARLVFEGFDPEVESRDSFDVIVPKDPNLLEAKPIYHTFTSNKVPPPTHIIFIETNFVFTATNVEGNFGYVKAFLNGETYPMMMSTTMSNHDISTAATMPIEAMPLLYQYILGGSNLPIEGFMTTSAVDILQPTYQLPYNSSDNVIYIAGNGKEPFILPSNAVVDIIIDGRCCGSHPFHLHGHHFYILDSSSNHDEASSNSATDDYYTDQVSTSPTHAPSTPPQVVNPTLRDIAVIPQGGWVRIRIFADNPGVWIFHCHVHWHMELGLAATFIEAPRKIRSHYQSHPIPPNQLAMCMDGKDHSKVNLDSTLSPFSAPTSAPTASVTPKTSDSPTMIPSSNLDSDLFPSITPTSSITRNNGGDEISMLPTNSPTSPPTIIDVTDDDDKIDDNPLTDPSSLSTDKPTTLSPTTLSPTTSPTSKNTIRPQDIMLPIHIQLSLWNISTFFGSTGNDPQELLLMKAFSELLQLTIQQVLTEDVSLFLWVNSNFHNEMQAQLSLLDGSIGSTMQLRFNRQLQSAARDVMAWTIYESVVQMMPTASLLSNPDNFTEVLTSEQLASRLSKTFLSSVNVGDFLRTLRQQVYLYNVQYDNKLSTALLKIVKALDIANASFALTNIASVSPTPAPTNTPVTTSSFTLQYYFRNYFAYSILIICILACCILSLVFVFVRHKTNLVKDGENCRPASVIRVPRYSTDGKGKVGVIKTKKSRKKHVNSTPAVASGGEGDVSSPANTMDDLQLVHEDTAQDENNNMQSNESPSRDNANSMQYFHTEDVDKFTNRNTLILYADSDVDFDVVQQQLQFLKPGIEKSERKISPAKPPRRYQKNPYEVEHYSIPTLTDPNSFK